MNDLSLYLVTDEAMCGARGVPATVVEAVRGGVTAVQVRAKDATVSQIVATVQEIRTRLDDAALPRVPIIVNDNIPAAAASRADGVHLGQSDGDPVAARERLGPDVLIGYSIGNQQELNAAHHLPAGTVDHFGIGPGCQTGTKPDAGQPLGPSGVADLVRGTALPCVAIGGICAARVPDLTGIGLAGICVVSAICAAPDPRAAAEQLSSLWRAG